MSIADIFRSVMPSTQKAAETPAANQNAGGDPSGGNPTVPGANTPGNTQGNAPAAFPAKAEGEKSPLSGFEKLWDTEPTANNLPSTVPAFNVDPKKLMEAARNIDFTKVIPAEVLEKASKGDMQALAQAINASAQAGYAQSAAATTRIVQEALGHQAKTFKEQVLPTVLRNHSISQTLVNDELLTNPAVKPMVDAVKMQVSAMYPTASPDEIAKHTSDFFEQFSTEIVKRQGYNITKPDTTNQASARKVEDWEKFFGAPVS